MIKDYRPAPSSSVAAAVKSVKINNGVPDEATTVGEIVAAVLTDEYFDHHTAMHLAREFVLLSDGRKRPLLPDPNCCPDCMGMVLIGEKDSGTQFLQMHHEMIRVFRCLLERQGVGLGAYWNACELKWDPKDPSGKFTTNYEPELWDLENYRQLPREIVGMLNVTDDRFLCLAFSTVQTLTRAASNLNTAIDKLGNFIERGVNQRNREIVNGSGFHNTMHDYLASREGKAAQGAEMNKLDRSRFNDYFWSLHLWIDAQYGRLLKRSGQDFNTTALCPENTEMFTHDEAHGPASGMSMA